MKKHNIVLLNYFIRSTIFQSNGKHYFEAKKNVNVYTVFIKFRNFVRQLLHTHTHTQIFC